MSKLIAEYIWIDGNGNLRSKASTLDLLPCMANGSNFIYNNHEIPKWNYDGSSTKQAEGRNSEIILYPCYAVPCPFRSSPHILVMCETYKSDLTPAANNNREWAKKIFDKNLIEKPTKK